MESVSAKAGSGLKSRVSFFSGWERMLFGRRLDVGQATSHLPIKEKEGEEEEEEATGSEEVTAKMRDERFATLLLLFAHRNAGRDPIRFASG